MLLYVPRNTIPKDKNDFKFAAYGAVTMHMFLNVVGHFIKIVLLNTGRRFQVFRLFVTMMKSSEYVNFSTSLYWSLNGPVFGK